MIKSILFGMLLTGLPPWAASTVADGTDDQAKVHTAVVVLAGDEGGAVAGCCDAKTLEVFMTPDGDDNEMAAGTYVVSSDGNVITTAGGAAGAAISAYVIASKEDENVEGGPRTLRVVAKAGTCQSDTGGWLGVSVGEPEKALVNQLDLGDRGVVILNVVRDSPADHAGIKTDDIVLSFDGEDIDHHAASLGRLVGSYKPGDKVEIVVLRNGEEEVLSAELGSRGNTGAIKWIRKLDPFAEVHESVITSGKIIRQDPDGEWIIEDLGDLDALTGLSEEVRSLFVPKGRNISTQVFVDGNRTSVKTVTRVQDGVSVSIEQEDDGEITVTRSDEDGEETVTIYADKEELAVGDPEAHELYKGTSGSAFVHLNLGDLDDIDIDVELYVEGLEDDLSIYWTDLEGRLNEAGEAYSQAMEHVHDVLRQALEHYEQAASDGRSEPAHRLPLPDLEGLESLHKLPMFKGLTHVGKPRHSFTVKEDGRIEARIRKGDSELVRVFSNEDDMSERNPELYEKYHALLEAEE